MRRKNAPTTAVPLDFDMSDPLSAEYAAGAAFARARLGPGAFIIDEAERILCQADEAIKMAQDDSARVFIERGREKFVRAMKTSRNPHAPEEARRQAHSIMVRAAGEIGEMSNWILGDVRVRAARRLLVEKAAKSRKDITPRQVEALRALCAEKGWPLETLTVHRKKTLAEEMGRSPHRIGTYLKIISDASR
jgi:hypothetical protein